jgi:phosphoglycolate phosphatase
MDSTRSPAVIGDTRHDLSCADVVGVRCLIVGTGRGGFESVCDLEADAVVEDLGDTDRILEILLADSP